MQLRPLPLLLVATVALALAGHVCTGAPDYTVKLVLTFNGSPLRWGDEPTLKVVVQPVNVSCPCHTYTTNYMSSPLIVVLKPGVYAIIVAYEGVVVYEGRINVASDMSKEIELSLVYAEIRLTTARGEPLTGVNVRLTVNGVYTLETKTDERGYLLLPPFTICGKYPAFERKPVYTRGGLLPLPCSAINGTLEVTAYTLVKGKRVSLGSFRVRLRPGGSYVIEKALNVSSGVAIRVKLLDTYGKAFETTAPVVLEGRGVKIYTTMRGGEVRTGYIPLGTYTLVLPFGLGRSGPFNITTKSRGIEVSVRVNACLADGLLLAVNTSKVSIWHHTVTLLVLRAFPELAPYKGKAEVSIGPFRKSAVVEYGYCRLDLSQVVGRVSGQSRILVKIGEAEGAIPIVVLPSKLVADVSPLELRVGAKYLMVSVRDGEGNPVPGARVLVECGSSRAESVTDRLGRAAIPVNKLDLNPGSNMLRVTAVFRSLNCSSSFQVIVKPYKMRIEISCPSVVYEGEDLVITVRVSDEDGAPLPGAEVSVRVDGQPLKGVLTNQNGTATIGIGPLQPGKHRVVVEGSYWKLRAQASAWVEVRSRLIAKLLVALPAIAAAVLTAVFILLNRRRPG